MICTLALHIKNDSKHTWIAKSKQIEYFAAFLLAELYFRSSCCFAESFRHTLLQHWIPNLQIKFAVKKQQLDFANQSTIFWASNIKSSLTKNVCALKSWLFPRKAGI